MREDVGELGESCRMTGSGIFFLVVDDGGDLRIRVRK